MYRPSGWPHRLKVRFLGALCIFLLGSMFFGCQEEAGPNDVVSIISSDFSKEQNGLISPIMLRLSSAIASSLHLRVTRTVNVGIKGLRLSGTCNIARGENVILIRPGVFSTHDSRTLEEVQLMLLRCAPGSRMEEHAFFGTSPPRRASQLSEGAQGALVDGFSVAADSVRERALAAVSTR